jgi:aminopeptidase-like protein
MNAVSLRLSADAYAAAGERMYALAELLYPICRSITGEGLRQTLRHLANEIPLQLCEVPSGTQVFDWIVPKEWNIRAAHLKNSCGDTLVDFQWHNLHVLNYSTPVRARMSLAELRPHLFSLPDHPDWIPYRTSYYRENWGFCLPHRQLAALPEDDYEVLIDSSLTEGALSYGECVLPGQTTEEVLLFAHCCHPSLANDNLSGMAIAVELARILAAEPRRYTYRLVFAPGTIGCITWLATHADMLDRVRHGLVLAVAGDAGPLSYKKTRFETATIDRAAMHVLKHRPGSQILEFLPYGYDERQFATPGINLPVGRLTRSPNGAYPQYHTSADNLALIAPRYLADSLDACLTILNVVEHDAVYQNMAPMCEPQLGRRGLYRATGGQVSAGERELALLWVLNRATGSDSLLDIADKANLPFEAIWQAAMDLERVELIKKVA